MKNKYRVIKNLYCLIDSNYHIYHYNNGFMCIFWHRDTARKEAKKYIGAKAIKLVNYCKEKGFTVEC